ncbi:hypothetical protein ABH924_003290 [Arthrobacter sp. GAS37]|uniref:HAD domain-containing protein n=1 Tax=Arthrobacter sp. GAS37 TaxID=3156261 RepID=UPI003837E87A
MTTHLYLDIDGVLNAWLRGPKSPSLWDGGYEFHQCWYGEYVAPAMISRLNTLIAEHGITGHWLTTWMEAAPMFGSLIGLEGSESWPVLEAVKGTGRHWSKWSTIRRHFNTTQPDAALWIDDDLALNRRALRWAKTAGVLAWAPNGFHGITPAMLEDIEQALDTAAREPSHQGDVPPAGNRAGT